MQSRFSAKTTSTEISPAHLLDAEPRFDDGMPNCPSVLVLIWRCVLHPLHTTTSITNLGPRSIAQTLALWVERQVVGIAEQRDEVNEMRRDCEVSYLDLLYDEADISRPKIDCKKSGNDRILTYYAAQLRPSMVCTPYAKSPQMHFPYPFRALIDSSVYCGRHGQCTANDRADACQEAGKRLWARFAIDDFHRRDVVRYEDAGDAASGFAGLSEIVFRNVAVGWDRNHDLPCM